MNLMKFWKKIKNKGNSENAKISRSTLNLIGFELSRLLLE